MKVLVINSGSSSIKYKLFDMQKDAVLATGLLERIGEPRSCLTYSAQDARNRIIRNTIVEAVADHRGGLRLIGAILKESGAIPDPAALYGIGHRVVHGGENFRAPVLINNDVMNTIRNLVPLAPLHNPANILGIEVALEFAPDVPQVAVFDTAFHQSLPPYAFRYALPSRLYEKYQVRRYGFHGTSHAYVAKQAARHLKRSLTSLRLITLHLGNGASICAVKNGRSIDTSMGMTPLEGLIMGTRCGDLDPAIIFYLARKAGYSIVEIEDLLNKESGLKGICGVNDMREILQRAAAGEAVARLAVDMYCYRIKKYIGAYGAVLGPVDALVFTGGVGENAAAVRSQICADLAHLGFELDPKRKTGASGRISELQTAKSAARILVVPTDEELEIAEQTVKSIRKMD